ILTQLGRILREGDGVQVHDAEDAVIAVLFGDPMADGTEIIAQRRRTGGLDAGEDAWARRLLPARRVLRPCACGAHRELLRGRRSACTALRRPTARRLRPRR